MAKEKKEKDKYIGKSNDKEKKYLSPKPKKKR